jgi:hypothetical protein
MLMNSQTAYASRIHTSAEGRSRKSHEWPSNNNLKVCYKLNEVKARNNFMKPGPQIHLPWKLEKHNNTSNALIQMLGNHSEGVMETYRWSQELFQSERIGHTSRKTWKPITKLSLYETGKKSQSMSFLVMNRFSCPHGHQVGCSGGKQLMCPAHEME